MIQDLELSEQKPAKKHQLLLGFLLIFLLFSVGVISYWWGTRNIKNQQSDEHSSLYKIELPKWLKKEDLSRLSDEERIKLNQYIGEILNQLFKKNPPPSKFLPVTVVLAQNGQPIFPSVTPTRTYMTPTSSPIPSGTNPTPNPSSPISSPTNNPYPTSPSAATPTPTSVPGVTYFPTLTPAIQPTTNPTISPSPTITPIPGADLVFNIDPAATQLYRQYTNTELADDIQRFYNQAKIVYGPPRQPLTVYVLANTAAPISYNSSINTISIGNTSDDIFQFRLISAILSAFHDDMIYYMPENWEVGMNGVASYEIYKKFFVPLFDSNLQAPFYTIYNTQALTNTHGLLYNNVLTPHISPFDLVVTALYQPYFEDTHFLSNLNNAIYQEPLDNNLYRKIHSLAISIKPTYLDEPFSGWLDKQFILGIQPATGKYLNIIMFFPLVESPFSLQALEIDSRGNKHAVGNLAIGATAWDSSGTQVWSAQTISQANGEAYFPGYPQPAASYTGCLKFKIEALKFSSTYFYYPYENGLPLVNDPTVKLGIFGCIQDKSDGQLLTSIFTGQPVSAVQTLTSGSFKLDTLSPFLGYSETLYFESSPQVLPNAINRFMKISRDYYLSLPVISTNPSSSPIPSPTSSASIAPQPSFSSTPSPSVKLPTLTPTRTPTPIRTPTPTSSQSFNPQSSGPSSADCASGWQTRTSTNFNFSVKYPSTWTHDSPGRSSSEGPTNVRFALTDWPYGQAPSSGSKWDNIDVVGSTSDLKNSEYGAWLEDATGLQQKSTVIFHGLSTEKYIADVEAASGSQHWEKYYFKGGNIYYIIRSQFFFDTSTRQQKLAILQCFMDNFRFLDD